MNNISFFSPAKINLGLSIEGRLPNGYHKVETVMMKIPFDDEITVRWIREDKSGVICNNDLVPNNSNNLAYRAFSLLQRDFDLPQAEIIIDKKIPVGAGMSGGSSNAGYLLQTLKRELNLEISEEKMRDYAIHLGADVPFMTREEDCIYEQDHGLPTLQQTVLPSLPDCQMVLVLSELFFGTAEMYAQMDAIDFKSSQQNNLVQAIKNQSLAEIAANLENDFKHLVFKKYPQIRETAEKLSNAGALGVGLSGKGPTLFAIFAPESKMPKEVNYVNIDIKAN